MTNNMNSSKILILDCYIKIILLLSYNNINIILINTNGVVKISYQSCVCVRAFVSSCVRAFVRACARACVCKSRTYELNRNGDLTNSFSYVCDGKKIKELFTSTLNGVAAVVRYVSFTPVNLNSKLFD